MRIYHLHHKHFDQVPRIEMQILAAVDSIGVLPLENLSGNPEEEYFAEEMSEALIAGLSFYTNRGPTP